MADVPLEPPLLYKSWSGFSVTKFSYSIAKDVASCGVYTQLSRFEGRTEKVDSAALKFGICLEDAIYDHYRFGLDLREGMRAKWSNYETIELKYSKNDKDWENLNNTGQSLMREFEAIKEDLPIHSPEFSAVIPRDPAETWYNGTRLEYLADCISHPFEGDLLLDIKTSGRAYPDGDNQNAPTYGYPALDPQLRTGALVSGIRQVGFLVFVKTRIPKIQFHTGYVTDKLLEQQDAWLKEQYHRLIEGRLTMNAGVRFPDERCKFCSFLPVCLGHDEIAEATLRRKSSKETDETLRGLDDVE